MPEIMMVRWQVVLLLSSLAGICAQQHATFAAAPTPAATPSAADALNVNTNLRSKAIAEFATHSKIRPTILHGKYESPIQNTLDLENGLHIPHITLLFYHAGQHITADLQRNDDLLPAEHFIRYQNSNIPEGYTLQNFTKTEVELCHYQGKIRGQLESSVAVSTCNGGINGLIFDGSSTYYIHSDDNSALDDDHYLFQHADLKTEIACGYNNATDDFTHPRRTQINSDEGDERPLKTEKFNMKHSGGEFNRILRYKRSYDENRVIRGPYNANKHSSYVELVIVVDNKVYKSFGENTKKVHQHCKDLANIINALYVPLNIFIALVGVVIWNESNEIEFSNDGDVTLRNFLHYRRTKLVLDHPNDNAQLITKEQFNGGVVGKALKGPICTHEYSGGVSMEHSQIIAVVATTMAHEMGHNFGMEHDSLDCKCQEEKCIMSASSTSVVPVHWSSCSIDQLNIAFSRGMNYCLRNKPSKLFDSPQCGNGFVEPGEQCDCGLESYCTNTCCDPLTCMLHTNASCATGECCDLNTCRPKVAGTRCRASENECDLAEYCTGESEFCPADVYKRDTEECDSGRAYCYQGSCRSHSNQCRILWGPTGESSEHCYWKNVEGKRGGNCGYNRLNSTFIPCDKEHVDCGMLHCRHLNERLEFGMESAAVLSHSFINHDGNIVPCRTALVDLGLQSTDPGLTPNGAKCGDHMMCLDQKCQALADLLAAGMGRRCPNDCNGHGVCNSRGNCHCDVGYTGVQCSSPGHGGSTDSGPATNPNSHRFFQRFMYIFFFLVLPLIAVFLVILYYWRNRSFSVGTKLAENIRKSTGGSKHPGAPARPRSQPNQPPSGGGAAGTLSMPQSTPSSTDDMNSALLRSPSDSLSNGVAPATATGGGMFGKFKGFTLRPLPSNVTATSNLNGPNVAYVQPTVQEHSIAGVPQRHAPPPPPGTALEGVKQGNNNNSTLPRKAPGIADAPALPPPNPGSHARPIISKPVLEASTLSLPLRTGDSSTTSSTGTLKAAPPPPVPLHGDPKLNVRRDGTIRRIASFLKKEDRSTPPPAAKEKTYIDRDTLRSLEISSPMPMDATPTTPGVGESSNSDSETTASPQDEETKNLVKRAQSMRSPTKKPTGGATNVQTFGSMRYPPGAGRPKSVVAAASARPRSPPPRPPPVLRKTNSTTSSGYQMPVTAAKQPSLSESAYDDCEFVEPSGGAPGIANGPATRQSTDNIYSVIDEIPPASQTLRRSDLVNDHGSGKAKTGSNPAGDMGLLGEIVSEIEKRNGGDSIYSGSTLAKNTPAPEPTFAAANKTNAPIGKSSAAANKPSTAATTSSSSSSSSSSYLRPTAVNTPVARVAPTRSDLSPSTEFSSFRPAPQGGNAKTQAAAALASQQSRFNTKANTVNAAAVRKPSFNKPPVVHSASTASAAKRPTVASNGQKPAATSATIQKPKLLSAKPSFSGAHSRSNGPAGGNHVPPPSMPNTEGTTTARPTSASVKSLSQRFEKGTAEK